MSIRNRYSRINGYHIMWLFVMFDLPTENPALRKKYAQFRKNIQGDGFTMLQYSIYTRHCPSIENATVHIERIRKYAPDDGHISIIKITDKQYSGMINLIGQVFKPMKSAPGQLELF